MRHTLTDFEFISDHHQHPQDFTSTRALPFATIVTKGAISQSRAKLKTSVLIALNEGLLLQADEGARLTRWMMHRLLAIDGSSLHLNAFAGLAKAFGGLLW